MLSCVLRVCDPLSCALQRVAVELLKRIYILCFTFYRSILSDFMPEFGPVLRETLFVCFKKFVILTLLALRGLGTLQKIS